MVGEELETLRRLPIHSNIFPSKRSLQEYKYSVNVYRVEQIPRDDKHFKNLSDVAKQISYQLGVLAAPYSPGDKDYVLALEPTVIREFIGVQYPVKLEKQNELLIRYPQQAREFHYEATRRILERHGMWGYTYNKYFEFYPERIIGEYEAYRGFCFRFDLINDRMLLTIDPITRIATQGTLWELISKFERKEARRKLNSRYVLATQENGKAIYQIVKIDFDTNVNDECISIGDKVYSVKSYFRRPGGKRELADRISDNECVVIVRRKRGAKELYMAPSLLKLLLRTDYLSRERAFKQELKNEVYLSVERRLLLVKKFLAIINPLTLVTKGDIEFDSKEISSITNESGVFNTPELYFGGRELAHPDLSNYGRFMKNTLLRLGPAQKAAFMHNKLVIVYPSQIAIGIIRSFYEDCKKISSKYFRTHLPNKPILYKYPDIDVRKEYNSFKEDIDAVIAILQSEEETETYFNFKGWFDKPNQVLTYRILNEKSRQIGDYYNMILNICAGLLGKMGGCPWILRRKLNADFYIGLDVGGEKNARVACYTFFDAAGNYRGETWRPQRGEEIDPSELKRILVNEVKNYKEHIGRIVIHRDGEFRSKELEGIEFAQEELIKDGIILKDSGIVCVNIKKNVPYRLYEVKNGKEKGCATGSYLILDDHNGILATTGTPILTQGLARPMLIELVPPFDKANIKEVMEDIYFLSYMHWGSILKKMRLPATIRYADAITPFALKRIMITGIPL